jgi:hypothetical protein
MGGIRRFFIALTSLPFAAAPAAALVIAPSLDVSSQEDWARFDGSVLEFDDRDWAIFIGDAVNDFSLPALDAVDADAGDGDVEGLVTQVWEEH